MTTYIVLCNVNSIYSTTLIKFDTSSGQSIYDFVQSRYSGVCAARPPRNAALDILVLCSYSIGQASSDGRRSSLVCITYSYWSNSDNLIDQFSLHSIGFPSFRIDVKVFTPSREDTCVSCCSAATSAAHNES